MNPNHWTPKEFLLFLCFWFFALNILRVAFFSISSKYFSKPTYMFVRDNCYSDSLCFVVVQFLSCAKLFATPRPGARQAPLSITNSRSLLKLMSLESVLPSNPHILCPSLLLPPSIFPHIRVFPIESALRFRWPKYWSFIFSISPSCTLTKKWKYIFLSLPSYSPHPVFKARVELLMQENSNSEMWSSLMLKKKKKDNWNIWSNFCTTISGSTNHPALNLLLR